MLRTQPTRVLAILAIVCLCGVGTAIARQQQKATDLPGARVGASGGGGQQQAGGGGQQQPGTRWSEEQLREAVQLARVGKKLTPKSWPNNTRVAVCLSFDVDNESYLLASGEISPTTLSAARFRRRVWVAADAEGARQVSGACDILHPCRQRRHSSRDDSCNHEKRAK